MKRLTLMAFVLVAGCGGGSDTDSSASLAEATGCERLVEVNTEELFAQRRFECGEYEVYTFADSEARDAWREAAETFGTIVVDEGDDWLKVEAD